MSEFSDAIRSGDTRIALEALRDYITHELDSNRCPKCQASQLRTGDTASLVLRLQKVLEEIATLPTVSTPDQQEGVTSLASIRNRRPAGATASDDKPFTGGPEGRVRRR